MPAIALQLRRLGCTYEGPVALPSVPDITLRVDGADTSQGALRTALDRHVAAENVGTDRHMTA